MFILWQFFWGPGVSMQYCSSPDNTSLWYLIEVTFICWQFLGGSGVSIQYFSLGSHWSNVSLLAPPFISTPSAFPLNWNTNVLLVGMWGKGGTLRDIYENQKKVRRGKHIWGDVIIHTVFRGQFVSHSFCQWQNISGKNLSLSWSFVFLMCSSSWSNVFSFTDRLFAERHTVHKARSRGWG